MPRISRELSGNFIVSGEWSLCVWLSAGDTEAAVRRLTACLVDIEAWLKASRLDWTPPRPKWCGWVLHNSWRKLTSRRRPVTSASSSTASWRCLHRCSLCVAVAITSYGSSDRLSDRCHLMLSRRWSRRLFHVTWTTATRCSTASRTVWWAGCGPYRMRSCTGFGFGVGWISRWSPWSTWHCPAWLRHTWLLTVSWSLTKVVVSCRQMDLQQLWRQILCCCRSEAVEQTSNTSETNWR